ncbi:hypothetical protein DFH07DRAFT_784761 [Mycena maculata]|uniref:BTB domain-containing protein n=1 Tax=Mycena maculata TaxID=230809 RepID=A0AAD7HFL4_9AGAR|nr:hypothetical protein DFH07DRAFT_784761 [Mycena maculata]
MDVNAELKEIHQVPGLWFEDGSLIIQAGDCQFRVYRGVLAKRSSVFQDMLSFPQPADAELVEGYFDTIVGCLRLSEKYRVDYLRRRASALVHPTSRCCTTLSECDNSTYPGDIDDHTRSALDIIS